MRKRSRSPQEIAKALRTYSRTLDVELVAQRFGVSRATVFRWRAKARADRIRAARSR